MQSIRVRERQEVIDIAMEHVGAVESVIDLCIQNDLSVTEQLISGQQLKNPGLKNKWVSQFFNSERIIPVSSAGIVVQGIGSWAVSIDFIVS